MQRITVSELLKTRSKTLTDVAAETGLSVSTICKLKYGQNPLTKRTREILEKKYGVILVEVNESVLLQNKIKKLETNLSEKTNQLNDANEILDKIKKSDFRKRLITELTLLPDSFWGREDVWKAIEKITKLKVLWENENNHN